MRRCCGCCVGRSRRHARAESSNHRWRWVESLVDVRPPDVRRGRQLFVTVQWAGANPLFECPWSDSEVLIGDLTGDLRAVAWGAMPMAWGIAWRKNTCRDALVVVYAPSEKRL